MLGFHSHGPGEDGDWLQGKLASPCETTTVAETFNEAKGYVTASINKVQGFEISKFSTFSVTVHSFPCTMYNLLFHQ